MRKKEWKLIITFSTTESAMAMEEVCQNRQVEGRLIPTPQMISAGCGLAWCASPRSRKILTDLMEQAGIRAESVVECLF
jgi:hypothetical protein